MSSIFYIPQKSLGSSVYQPQEAHRHGHGAYASSQQGVQIVSFSRLQLPTSVRSVW